MAAMARHLGDTAAVERYEAAWARSSAAIDALLYNGEYFQQQLDDVDEHRYQFGDGVLTGRGTFQKFYQQGELKAYLEEQLGTDAVPAALEKAHLYRLLNEPSDAESICRDVLAVDPENQEALVTLTLALSDQLEERMGALKK